MRLGVFSVCDTYARPGTVAPPERLEELLRLAVAAERRGYDRFWITEHHFQAGSVLPAPPVFLAAAARETRQIRLGSMVSVLPLHHPVELAEQFNLVDRLSRGRLDIGLGTGYLEFEFQGLGRDPARRSAEFDRTLPTFLAALAGRPVNPAGSEGGDLRLNVLPWQRPHAPIWRAAGRTDSIRAAGRAGLGLALVPYATLPELRELGRQIREYRAALPSGAPPRVLAAMHVRIGPDTDAAERALQRFLDSRARPRDPAYQAFVARHPEAQDAARLRESGLALLGRPSEVRERLEELEGYGVTDLAAILDFGGATPEEARPTLSWLRELVPRAAGADGTAEIRPGLSDGTPTADPGTTA